MLKFIATMFSMLLVAGCKGGGGDSLLSSLFGGSSSGSVSSGSGSTPGVSPGEAVAFVHTPKPSSLILLGVGLAGLAAMAFKRKKKL